MRTFAGIGLVLALEVAAVAAAVWWRMRARRRRKRSEDGHHQTVVLELEPADAALPAEAPRVPARVLDELRKDPMLGLADVRLVQHVQPTGAGLPERSQVGTSYQSLNQAVARRTAAEPIPAVRMTWLSLRLELPGSRNHDWTERAAGPILARGGGSLGAERTLDKAARTASAKLATVGFVTTRLRDTDLRSGLEATVESSDDVSTFAGGVLVGVDPAHRPVVLGLFRRRTLTVGVVGGLHLAQILALRCAAIGARVIVETARQDLWDPVLLHSGLDASRLAVQPVGRIVGNPGWGRPTPTTPLLVLRDCGARPPFAATPHGPWTSVLTLLPFLDLRAAGHLSGADLVGLQRMPSQETAIAKLILGLPDKDLAALLELPDHMALWRAKGRASRYCELAATKWEEAFLGEPVR